MRIRCARAMALILVFAVIPYALSACFLGRGPVRPAVAILSPENGAKVAAGQPVEVRSIALDDRGIASVELLVDGVSLQTDTTPKGEIIPSWEVTQTWTPDSPGRHQVEVRAVNRAGVESAPYRIVVEVLPAEAVAGIDDTPTPTPTGPPSATPHTALTPTAPACMNNAVFVTDVTVPDDTPFRPGERFEKVWRMRNTGTCPWDASFTWAFESGEQMGAEPAVPVPPTIPGADADIRVRFVAPAEPGRYIGRWRMLDPQGRPFGQRATVVIQVLPADLEPPSPPTNVQATFQPPDKLVLSWRDTADNEQGFRIYLGEEGILSAELPQPDATGATISNVPCGEDITIRVRAYNQAGESDPARITVPAVPCAEGLPVILYFEAEPEEIYAGQSALLRWNLEGAREARLFPGGEEGVVAPGEMRVTPLETTSYRLVAVNEFGTVQAIVTVRVRGTPAAGGPTVTLTAEPTQVGEGEPFRITVAGRDEAGLESIWWWGVGTTDDSLDALHAHPCNGQVECAHAWDVKSLVSGDVAFRANARSTAGTQADQFGTLPEAQVHVVPILTRLAGISVAAAQCLDVETGQAGTCSSAGMDVQFLFDSVDGWMLRGQNGAQVAGLGIQPALESVSYPQIISAGFARQVLLGNSPDSILVGVRSDEGRYGKMLFHVGSAHSLTLDILVYLE